MPDPPAPAALDVVIEELRRLEREAQPGPITADLDYADSTAYWTGKLYLDDGRAAGDLPEEEQTPFARKLVAAYNALPGLLAALAAERSKRVELEAELADTKEELLVAGQSEGEAPEAPKR